jgi:hypothetical protein
MINARETCNDILLIYRKKGVSCISYTGRFIMFSVITNVYNNNNCSQPQENFFLTTKDVRCVHHG